MIARMSLMDTNQTEMNDNHTTVLLVLRSPRVRESDSSALEYIPNTALFILFPAASQAGISGVVDRKVAAVSMKLPGNNKSGRWCF